MARVLCSLVNTTGLTKCDRTQIIAYETNWYLPTAFKHMLNVIARESSSHFTHDDDDLPSYMRCLMCAPFVGSLRLFSTVCLPISFYSPAALKLWSRSARAADYVKLTGSASQSANATAQSTQNHSPHRSIRVRRARLSLFRSFPRAQFSRTP